jgi:hypothetical protein
MSLQIGVCLDERFHNGRVMFRRGPHQRRLVLRRLLRINRCVAGDQHADSVRIPALGASLTGVSPVPINVLTAPAFGSASTNAAFVMHA